MSKAVNRRVVTRVTDYQRTFQSEAGQRVLYDLMKKFHVLGVTHYAGDPHQTAYQEGQRSVVLTIMNKLAIDPEKLMEQIRKGEEDEYRINAE